MKITYTTPRDVTETISSRESADKAAALLIWIAVIGTILSAALVAPTIVLALRN